MYYYIYDTFLSDSKYEKTIDKIKTRLLDLEIQGKHEKLTLLKSLEELVRDEVKRGANTVIALGNDKTFLKIVNIAAQLDITLGMIPIGPNNDLAKYFGIKQEEEACEILAARKVVKFDMGKIKDNYFFSNIKVNKNVDRLGVVKGTFKVLPNPNCSEVIVSNFYYPEAEQTFEKKMKKYSAQDGKLELIIRTKPKKAGFFKKKKTISPIDTIIQSTEFELKSFEYLPVIIDGYRVIKTPFKVEVASEKLKVIVGRDRLKSIK